MVCLKIREFALSSSCTPRALAACASSGIVAVASGSTLQLLKLGSDGVQLLQQIPLTEPGNAERPVVATCALFAAPGVLLVAAGTWLLGFRVFAGTHHPAHWSFAEPLPSTATLVVRCRHCTGAAVVLLAGAGRFAVFQWRERLSSRCVSVADVSTHPLVAAALSADGRFLALADARGRLYVLSFAAFDWRGGGGFGPGTGRGTAVERTAEGGTRLRNSSCSRSGIVMRDNPLDAVRIVAETGGTGSWRRRGER